MLPHKSNIMRTIEKKVKLLDTVKEVKLLDTVDDGFNYFNYRLEELKTDDKYYINSFMDYIQCLEIKINKLSKKLKTK